MTNRCDNCKHSKVCIYKQKYYEKYMTLENEQKYYDKYMSENEQQQVEPFIITLECKEYESKSNIIPGHVKDFEIGISPLTINPCEGCSTYEDIKKGKIIISDICSFCSKSPLKIGD